MAKSNEICMLDYFFGTIATAYKGVITSLAAKDFCISEEDGFITLTAVILSMPDGEYEARLMHEGKELARSVMTGGSFELKVEDRKIKDAKNLQIDVVQKGRHIGTFLLKREKPEQFYTSALELSEDLRDLDAPKLTSPLQNRPGLLKRAEDMISKLISAKKDWKRLSEEINTFSKDLFWSDHAAFSAWYEVLVKWSSKACSMSSEESVGRAVSNFLFLIELPLEHLSAEAFAPMVQTWLSSLMNLRIDMSSRLSQAESIFSRIQKEIPGIDIGPAVNNLVIFLEERVKNAPALSSAVLDQLRNIVAEEEFVRLEDYSERTKGLALESLRSAETLLEQKKYAEVFNAIMETGATLLDDTRMVDQFFSIIENNVGKGNGEILSGSACALFAIFGKLSPGALKAALSYTARFIERLISVGIPEACIAILDEVEKGSNDTRESIVLNREVATSIISSGDEQLLSRYKKILKQMYIPSPGVKGFSSETWAEIINPGHIQRLANILSIIGMGKGGFNDILVYFLCNLYISNVFIPDDKLFQRDISAYLNSGAPEQSFLFSYMLLRKLPVYFNDVGATNIIRDDTTEIDSWGNDMVLYFIRKQVHVNASNNNVRLVEETIRSWTFNDPSFLKDVVPADVFNSVNNNLLSQYSGAMHSYMESLGVLQGSELHFERLVTIPDSILEQGIAGMGLSDEIRLKIFLICRIYRELVRKYSLFGRETGKVDISRRLHDYVRQIKALKKTVISPEKTVPHESLFFKRHIAFGIPSVLGSYHEPKFDALAKIFRTENRMIVLFEELISAAEKTSADIAAGDFSNWVHCLDVMNELLKIHEIGNFQINEAMTILKTNPLHVSQIIDLLRIWQKELTWIVDFLNRRIHGPLAEILAIFPREETAEYLRGFESAEKEDYIHKASDIVIRDMINSICGFTQMDRFVDVLIKKFQAAAEAGSDNIMMPDAKEHVGIEAEAEFYVLDHMHTAGAMRLAPFIGGKAKNLVYLIKEKLPVPFGVVLSSKHTPNYLQYTDDAHFMNVLKDAIQKIESATELSFGDARKPLFISVRSGSYISMPGILSSILYCGMNPETRRALSEITRNPWFAFDSHRRFIEHYATTVLGLDEKVLSERLAAYLNRNRAATTEQLSAAQMEDLVNSYSSELVRRGLAIPDDVYQQLKESAKAVYGSWYGEKAVHFRKAMGVSEHWGTSVLLMQMVYGNQKGSGASVFFTRNPSTLEKGAFGDTRETSTGDDLVYGRLINRPITRGQALEDQESLEAADPVLFSMHEEVAAEIEKAMGGLPQEVEATYITGPKAKRIIYVLQTRRMEIHRGFVKQFSDICQMESNIIGRGIGVHGGALGGIATFYLKPDEIEKLKRETEMKVILLRQSSSTQDVSLMPYIDGIITSAGGATSHAAILSQKFGITSVVGCSDMIIETDEKGEPVAMIGDYEIREGSVISIDGSTGIVYSGICEFTTEAK